MHLSNQSLLVILFVGIIAGWLAGRVMEGGGFGLIGDLLVGLIGAFVGDWLLPRLGNPSRRRHCRIDCERLHRRGGLSPDLAAPDRRLRLPAALERVVSRAAKAAFSSSEAVPQGLQQLVGVPASRAQDAAGDSNSGVKPVAVKAPVKSIPRT